VSASLSLSSEHTQAVSRASNSLFSTVYTHNSITSLDPALLFADVDSTEQDRVSACGVIVLVQLQQCKGNGMCVSIV
jgi:hypothetical protein